jgi:hypothetical protein
MLLALMGVGTAACQKAKHRGSDGPRGEGNDAGRQTHDTAT